MTVGHVFLFGFRSRCRSTLRYCKCSGQVNCPSAKVFAAGENACTAQSAAGQKAGLSPLCIAFHLNCNRTRCRWASIWFWVQNWGLASILLQCAKKQSPEWAAVFLFGFRSRWSLHPPVFQMLGASELPLRQGFRQHRTRGSKARFAPTVLLFPLIPQPALSLIHI